MRTHALRFVWPTAMLAAAVLSAGAPAASDELPLPEEFREIVGPAAGAAEIVGTDERTAGEDVDPRPAHSTAAVFDEAAPRTGESLAAETAEPDAEAHGQTGVWRTVDAEAPPASRLLRSLGQRAARPASPPATMVDRAADAHSGAAGTPVGDVLYGCPRALLRSLLAGAAEAGDAISALAIERETLALCRERQEIVNGIVALEGELGALLEEARSADAGAPAPVASAAVIENPIVKETAPVRVVSLPPASDAAGEAPNEAEAPPPAPPAYFWFSIIGTAGDLRAGIGDGERVWFVREGERLPGDVLIAGIGTKPPGVRIAGAGEAALPYRPRPVVASAAGDDR